MNLTLGPTVEFNRLSEMRQDKEYMASLVESETSRFFVLAGGKPVVDSNADRTQNTIHWFTGPEITEMGLATRRGNVPRPGSRGGKCAICGCDE